MSITVLPLQKGTFGLEGARVFLKISSGIISPKWFFLGPFWAFEGAKNELRWIINNYCFSK